MSADGTSATQRGVAVVVALAIHALLVLALVWKPQPRPEPAATAPEPESAQDAATERAEAADEPTTTARDTAPPARGSARPGSPEDARQRAQGWLSRLDRSLRQQRSAQFGDEIAAIMDAPLDEAWPELVARAAERDTQATAALMTLAGLCEPSAALANARPLPSGFDPAAGASFIARDDREWLRAAALKQDAADREAARACQASGIGFGALQRAFDEHGIDDPLSRWFSALEKDKPLPPPPPDLLDHGDMLAELAADILLESTDAAARRQALAFMESRADVSRGAALAVAQCHLSESCGAPADASTRAAVLERAAGWGHAASISALAESALEAGDPASAWAWRAYQIALDDAGCVGNSVTYSAYAIMSIGMRDRQAQRERTMTAAQLAAGRARLAELDAQYGARTRAALGCGP